MKLRKKGVGRLGRYFNWSANIFCSYNLHPSKYGTIYNKNHVKENTHASIIVRTELNKKNELEKKKKPIEAESSKKKNINTSSSLSSIVLETYILHTHK